MVTKIAAKLFQGVYKWLFIILIAFLPQFAFLGSYLNNDSLALFSSSLIIYSWILGMQNKWNRKSCILLGVGVGICALSYYNAYGFILLSVIFFIVSVWMQTKQIKEIFKKGILIFLISFLIAGWWFIRNAIIYEGDFLGLATENEYAEKYAIDEYKPSLIQNPKNAGKTLWFMLKDMHWLKITYYSFIGVFGPLSINISYGIYFGYFLFYLVAFIGVMLGAKKLFIGAQNETKLLNYCFIFSIIIPIILSMYYSYANDFQPQGRYIMPMIIPFTYFVVYGIKNIFEIITKNKKLDKAKSFEKINNQIILLLCIIIIGICIYCLTNVIIPYYHH